MVTYPLFFFTFSIYIHRCIPILICQACMPVRSDGNVLPVCQDLMRNADVLCCRNHGICQTLFLRLQKSSKLSHTLKILWLMSR